MVKSSSGESPANWRGRRSREPRFCASSSRKRRTSPTADQLMGAQRSVRRFACSSMATSTPRRTPSARTTTNHIARPPNGSTPRAAVVTSPSRRPMAVPHARRRVAKDRGTASGVQIVPRSPVPLPRSGVSGVTHGAGRSRLPETTPRLRAHAEVVSKAEWDGPRRVGPTPSRATRGQPRHLRVRLRRRALFPPPPARRP
jgi:hypothetical protein